MEITFSQVFRPFTLYFVEATLAAVTASSLGYDATRLAHLYLATFILLCRSSQALSGWMRKTTAQLFSGLSRGVRLG